MNPRWIKPLIWLSMTAFSAALAFSAGSASPTQGQVQSEAAEKVLNYACAACHDLRPVAMTATDKEGWTRIVTAMVDKGAEVKKDDVPILVNYLVANYGPLPEGPGKDILLSVCTQCHSLDRVKARGANRAGWEDLLLHMLNEGASLSDREYDVLLTYLTRNFRP